MSTDLLVIAGAAAEILERQGFIACGRRENGVARVDFWTREGIAFRHTLQASATDTETSVDDVVAACVSAAGPHAPKPPARRISHLS